MNTYSFNIIIPAHAAHLNEVAIALLSELGFDGFEEQGALLVACTTKEDLVSAAGKILDSLELNYSLEMLEPQNWNALWESSFEPVRVDDFVSVRAGFHPAPHNVEHDLIITPKMSFGTGHHPTTYLMLDQMRRLDFTGKSVLDFGTGTGLLAILAEKMGAARIKAIDNDDWSINNARENIETNFCHRITLEKADKPTGQYDIILANINRQVLLGNMETLSNCLVVSGAIIISGFLPDDLARMEGACLKNGFRVAGSIERHKWAALLAYKVL